MGFRESAERHGENSIEAMQMMDFNAQFRDLPLFGGPVMTAAAAIENGRKKKKAKKRK
jgi:hypothetical protein